MRASILKQNRFLIASVQGSMSDADLESKFHGLADGILSADRVRRLIDLCWKIESAPQVSALARAAAF